MSGLGFAWLAFEAELKTWHRAGRCVRLWWRDDDAVGVTPSLTRLLTLSERYQVPLALAVVPGERAAYPTHKESLARLLQGYPLVSVLQHGTDHVNARPPGEPPSQFADDLDVAVIAERLSQGGAVLRPFLRFSPIYVPPWNRMAPGVARALAPAGLRGYSLFEDAVAETDLPNVNVHVDLLRWTPAPRFKGEARLLRRLTRLLRARRHQGAWDEPLGVLTHHLQTDEAAWAFQEALLARTARHPAVAWRGVTELLAGRAARGVAAGRHVVPPRQAWAPVAGLRGLAGSVALPWRLAGGYAMLALAGFMVVWGAPSVFAGGRGNADRTNAEFIGAAFPAIDGDVN